MNQPNQEENAKLKLVTLVKSIESVVNEQLTAMSPTEINYILANYKKFLNYDLSRDFIAVRDKNIVESPLDSIINDDLNFDLK